ncbi:MAG: hypothetical protein Q4E74_04625 [Ruminococcus sp.]|nr:hypothetical protein [Ruminococcus sp.]
MAKNFKYEYKQHIRNTAPDMDKLWDRIESEIDNKEKERITETTTYVRKIKHSHRGILTAAAAVLVVIFGAKIISNVSVETDDKNSDESNISISGNEEQENIGYPAVDTNEIKLYSSISFSSTDTQAYNANYTASGDEYFVEQKVLQETEYFADVTVQSARLTSHGGQYVLKVNQTYSYDGEELSISDITLKSATPYILQENREYLIPLAKDGDNWYIVFENAPQIELTLDGGAVFQNGWNSLEEHSCAVDKEESGVNDFYYDRMRYCSAQDLQELIDNWRQI